MLNNWLILFPNNLLTYSNGFPHVLEEMLGLNENVLGAFSLVYAEGFIFIDIFTSNLDTSTQESFLDSLPVKNRKG